LIWHDANRTKGKPCLSETASEMGTYHAMQIALASPGEIALKRLSVSLATTSEIGAGNNNRSGERAPSMQRFQHTALRFDLHC
jgi:hypothetical protein